MWEKWNLIQVLGGAEENQIENGKIDGISWIEGSQLDNVDIDECFDYFARNVYTIKTRLKYRVPSLILLPLLQQWTAWNASISKYPITSVWLADHVKVVFIETGKTGKQSEGLRAHPSWVARICVVLVELC